MVITGRLGTGTKQNDNCFKSALSCVKIKMKCRIYHNFSCSRDKAFALYVSTYLEQLDTYLTSKLPC